MPDRVIRAIIGHHSAAMTERYDRVEVRERRQAIGKVLQLVHSATEVRGRVGGSGSTDENAPCGGQPNGASSDGFSRAGDGT